MFELRSEHKSCLIKMEIATIQHSGHWRASSGTAKQTDETVYIIKNASACRVETPARHDIAIPRGKQNRFPFFFSPPKAAWSWASVRKHQRHKKKKGSSHSDKQCGENKPLQTLPLHLTTSQSLFTGCKTWGLLSQSTDVPNTMRKQVHLQNLSPESKSFGTVMIQCWSLINFLEQ